MTARCPTLCGTCRWWDSTTITGENQFPLWHRTSRCTWHPVALPAWASLHNCNPWTNEATVKMCQTYFAASGAQKP